MDDLDVHQASRQQAEGRIAEIWQELAVGEACRGSTPETWMIAEEELLDELTELELALLTRDPGPDARTNTRGQTGRWGGAPPA